MTSDGVDGTAADRRAEARPRGRPPGPPLIKHDDGRLLERYIEPAYPHTPAGATPESPRRERQVASALRNSTDFVIASLICGADGTTGRACAEARLRRAAAIGAPRRPAKGSR